MVLEGARQAATEKSNLTVMPTDQKRTSQKVVSTTQLWHFYLGGNQQLPHWTCIRMSKGKCNFHSSSKKPLFTTDVDHNRDHSWSNAENK